MSSSRTLKAPGGPRARMARESPEGQQWGRVTVSPQAPRPTLSSVTAGNFEQSQPEASGFMSKGCPTCARRLPLAMATLRCSSSPPACAHPSGNPGEQLLSPLRPCRGAPWSQAWDHVCSSASCRLLEQAGHQREGHGRIWPSGGARGQHTEQGWTFIRLVQT